MSSDSGKLPPALEALFKMIGIEVSRKENGRRRNPTEQMVDNFIDVMRTTEAKATSLVESIADVKDLPSTTPTIVHNKIKARGHDALAGTMLACENAEAAATALYRLTQDEQWLKAASFHHDLNELVTKSHDAICSDKGVDDKLTAVPILGSEYGKKVVGNA